MFVPRYYDCGNAESGPRLEFEGYEIELDSTAQQIVGDLIALYLKSMSSDQFAHSVEFKWAEAYSSPRCYQ